MQQVSNSGTPRVALVSGAILLGGSTTFLCNLAGELIRRKTPACIISFEEDNPLASDFQRLNIPVRTQGNRRLIFEDRIKIALGELSHFQPTVVVANLCPISFEVLRYVPKGVFRVGMGHSDEPGVYSLIGHYKTHLDLIAVPSETMRRKLAALPGGLGHTRVRCLPYGVPMTEHHREINRTLPLRILYLGRIYREQKRVHLFPRILEMLQKSGIPFQWTIAGEGHDRVDLEPLMRSTAPDQRIEFTGAVSYSDVGKILETHDIYLLASDYEGLPLSMLEAMGYGLVPVVSDLESGIRDVVDASNGTLVSIDDVDGYAQAILHLHEHRDELAAKSAAARARVQTDFSVGAMTDRWQQALPTTAVSMEWPRRFEVRGMLADPGQWKYHPFMRPIRRLLKRN